MNWIKRLMGCKPEPIPEQPKDEPVTHEERQVLGVRP